LVATASENRLNIRRDCTHSCAVHESAIGRFCCKSSFALVIKNSLGCRRDFRVKIWGTSSPDDILTGDLGNAIVAMSIDGGGSDCLAAGKLAPGNLGLLQQYRHSRDPSAQQPEGLLTALLPTRNARGEPLRGGWLTYRS
jgi:hypothetical protein